MAILKQSIDKPIRDLLSSLNPFRVPPYQRAYSWNTEQIEDFITDIQRLYDLRVADTREEETRDTSPHFFGSIICDDRFDSSSETEHVYEVVDGQQRLATFFITFGVLIRAFRELAEYSKGKGDNAT